MADGSWDNGGHGAPLKPGMPLWAKITLGCGIAFLIVLVTCVGGVAFVANKFKKDPEGAKRWAMGLATEKMRPDWDDFTQVVNQLRTPEGTRALYAANPDLAQTWPKEADFLKDAEAWRPNLPEIPPIGPELLEQGGLSINHEMRGTVRIDWRPKTGARIAVTFTSKRRTGSTEPRKVALVEVR
ncbi:MAG TPA: hypothetical protein VJ486_01315 [Geothrix sp.]|nr:hypothetical protein [Geothrix sp.]